MLRFERVAVHELSQAGEARRVAARIATEAGLDATEAGKLAIAVTEAATNVVKHGKGGEILLGRHDNQIELLAIDKGPGMRDPTACLHDGYSTAGSPGTGLGAVRRLASHFDIFSSPGVGTVLLARFGAAPHCAAQISGIVLAMAGERTSGDAFACVQRNDGFRILVVDGLGHGLHAAEAASEAVSVFQRFPHEPPAGTFQRIHEGLRKTRGAAAALAEIRYNFSTLVYVGVGNISGVILSGGATRSMISHNGILGHEARKIQEFTYPWPEKALLVMHSDGLSTHWDLSKYPGLTHRDPQVIAAVLYRDFRRHRDDVSVVVARARE